MSYITAIRYYKFTNKTFVLAKCKRIYLHINFKQTHTKQLSFSIQQVHYIAHLFVLVKNILYFCTKSEIYCTMKYGELIKERRAVLGLTQQDLSDYTELSLRIIKSVESEKSNPSLKTLEKIAEVLGLELIMRVKIINE